MKREPAGPRPARTLPAEELRFRASRSGGPGGQHVNTSSTRVEIRWNVATSRAVTDEERARVMARLGSRIDQDGWIRVVESSTRSQLRNREIAETRLSLLVAKALEVPKRRVRTKVPGSARRERLDAKRRRGTLKQTRGRIAPDDA